jgi:hypothetical protein
MNSCSLEDRYAPIAPGPIDFFRRRGQPIVVKRVQSTLPIKSKMTCNTQVYITRSLKDSIKHTVQK